MRAAKFIFFFAFLFVFCAQSAFSETDNLDEQYKYALGLYKRKLYEESITVLKKILAEKIPFSKRDGAWFWLGESLLQTSKIPESISAFDTLLREYPKSEFRDRGAYNLGWAHTRDNNPKSAIEAFSIVSKKDSEYYIDSRLKMGFLASKFGYEPAKILEIYAELLDFQGLSNEKKSDVLMNKGIQLFNIEKYDDAYLAFEDSLKTFPRINRPGILLYQAECRFRSNNFTEAEPLFKRLVDMQPKNDILHKALYGLSWCRIKLKKYEDAINSLSQLAYDHKAANVIEAQKNLIELLMNLKKFDQAIFWMTKIESLLPQEEAIQMNLRRGMTHTQTGNYDAAATIFKDFVKKNPKHAKCSDARYQLGINYISQGKFKDALDEFAPLLRRETEPAIREKAIYRTGECYFNLGNFKGARESFERLLKEYPDGNTKFDALYQFAEIEYSTGNITNALEAFKSLSESKNEMSGQAAFRIGEVLIKAEKYQDAILAFENYINRFPDGALVEDAKFKTGLAYLELKDTGNALAAFSEIRESKGYFRQEARFQIGEIARTMGNFPIAIQQFKAIVNEDPKNPLASRAKRAIGICLYQAKDFPAAIQTFESILKELPAGDIAVPESRLWYGRSLIAAGKDQDGIIELLKIPFLYPKSPLAPEAYSESARAYTKTGNHEKAASIWEEYLKTQSSGPLADEARQTIKKQKKLKKKK
ncbi:MAG: tetratricopeptide repeat protein [Candidatus Riflebacteria bacterium]|nr:tetratricopeptide repeat protein [Candidatus Riflebacteria bacterium]